MVLAGAAMVAVIYGWTVPDSSVHATVVKFVPGAKRAYLEGAIQFEGEPAPTEFSVCATARK